MNIFNKLITLLAFLIISSCNNNRNVKRPFENLAFLSQIENDKPIDFSGYDVKNFKLEDELFIIGNQSYYKISEPNIINYKGLIREENGKIYLRNDNITDKELKGDKLFFNFNAPVGSTGDTIGILNSGMFSFRIVKKYYAIDDIYVVLNSERIFIDIPRMPTTYAYIKFSKNQGILAVWTLYENGYFQIELGENGKVTKLTYDESRAVDSIFDNLKK